MRWWSELKYIVRKLNRRRAEQEAEEEIRTHLELEIREKIEAGVSPEEARRAARRAFGSVVVAKEESRAIWGFVSPETWLQDLRYGARILVKNPGFTLIAALTLALGIGVNTTLFTVYDAFLLKPLPLKDPDSIANIMGYDREGKRNRLFSYLDYVDYRDRATTFSGLIAWNNFNAPFGEFGSDVADSTVLPGNYGAGQLVSWTYFM